METLKLNQTPVRTSRNFNINNIKLNNVEIPEKVEEFTNLEITGQTNKIKIENNLDEYFLQYGAGDILINQAKSIANQKLKITIDSKTNKDLFLKFQLDKKNINLIDNIEILANEDTKATIYIKYYADEKIQGFHNGILKIFAKNNANINIIIVNLLNAKTNNFMSIDSAISEKAKVNYTIVDFGGKNNITNLYTNLLEKESDCTINTIYLGKEDQLIDINYIGELRGENSNINMEIQGALKDNAKKHFKGTIDFKKGSKKAKGNENEFCMLLSDTAKSLALPMLLCSEEDVEGNHSSAAGKVGEKQLFYIMSRGFEQKEAMKLMVKAKFNTIIESIKNEELKNEINDKIDTILD